MTQELLQDRIANGQFMQTSRGIEFVRLLYRQGGLRLRQGRGHSLSASGKRARLRRWRRVWRRK